MSGWNLPPGVTDADIDRAMGGEAPCAFCGVDLGDHESAEAVTSRGVTRWACDTCAARAEDEACLRDEDRMLGLDEWGDGDAE